MDNRASQTQTASRLQRQVINTLALCEAAGMAGGTMSIKRLAVLVRSDWRKTGYNPLND